MNSSRHLVLALAVASLSSASGCLLFDDFGELTGNDGGSDLTSDADDASANDAQTPDAFDSATANDDAQSTGTGFCAGKPKSSIYCEDFDEFDASIYEIGATKENGTVTLDDTQFTSSPRSFHATRMAITIPDASAIQTSANVLATTNDAPNVVHVEFDLLSPSPAGLPQGVDAPASLFTISVAGIGKLELTANRSSVTFVESDTFGNPHAHGSLPYDLATGSWNHVTLILDMSNAHGQITALVGKTSLTSTPTIMTWLPGLITLEYGLGRSQGRVDPADVRIDNVLVTSTL